MWVVKDVPEPIYGPAVSPRLIGNQLRDRSQRKRENCIAAALQCRSYRLRTDEFAKSHHCRGVSKVTRWRQVLRKEVLRHLDGIDNYSIGAHGKNADGTRAVHCRR